MAVLENAVNEAWARLARGDYAGAAELSRRMLTVAPEKASLLACHALSVWQLGNDIAAAITEMRHAVALAPEDAWMWHNLATILASSGDHGGAQAGYLKALELKPDDTEAFYGLSQSHKFTAETPAVANMVAQYESGRLTERAREFACYGLAKAYADLGQHDRAIKFCLEANALTERPYDADAQSANLDELTDLADADGFRKLTPGGNTSAAPVFIVGMPRSGTTLVETILARHGQVHAGGEMTYMVDVETVLMDWARANKAYRGGPHAMLDKIPVSLFTRNGDAVLDRIRTLAGRDFSLFTDKLPDNTQRLGLISLLYPHARVIYVRRHPLDCCVSNLFLRFAHGHGFSFRQELLGQHYRQVSETMAIWKRALDLPILDVNYARLVGDPEPEIRRLVSFLELEWDPACLKPEAAARSVLTASQWQVKQPINAKSVDRWRPYEPWLGPLIEAMGGTAWIERELAAMDGVADRPI